MADQIQNPVAPASDEPTPPDAIEDEIDCLTQRMDDSLPGSQQGAVSCSQASSNTFFSGAPRDIQDDMADSPSSSQEEPALLQPGCYQFPDTIHDARRYPWEGDLLRRFFNGQMVAPPEEFEYLSSQSKNFGCLRTDKTKKDPRYGLVWSLVDPLEGLGLTKYLLEAIYFFHTVEALSRQYKWNGFVIKTNNLRENLYPKFAPGDKEKDVVGVVSKCTIDREADASFGGPGGVDFERLLDMGNQASGGQVSTSLPLLKIYLSITGAIADGKRKLFGVVSVHWLLNVNFMPFLTDKLLSQPLRGVSSFAEVSERNANLRELFEMLLLKQLSMMKHDRSGQHPRDFYEKPNAELGAHTLLNPMLIPFKIARVVGQARSLKIIGFPNINWRDNPAVPGPLRDYLRFMEGYTAHAVEWCANIQAYCKAPSEEPGQARGGRRRRGGANAIQEPEDDSDCLPTEHSLKIIPGWPTGEQQGNYHSKWHLELCPITMHYRPLKPPVGSENRDCFMINIGGLPELVMCLIRSFLFYSRDNTDSDRLNSLNMEHLREKWHLFGVRKAFYGDDGLKNMQLATQGCKMELYDKTVQYLKDSIKNGSMSCQAAVRIYGCYTDMALCMTSSMIENGNFISAMMTQILKVQKALYAEDGEGGTRIYKALNTLQSAALRSVPKELAANPLDFYRRMLLQALVWVNNKGQMLNSVNLSNKLAIIVSVLSYSVGRVNVTTENIGRGVEIAPCAGTAREVVLAGNAKEERTMTNNPNGSGKDMAVETVNKDYNALMHFTRLFLDTCDFTIEVLTGTTETALLLASCIQIAGGDVISLPDPSKVRRPSAITEMRAENPEKYKTFLNGLIKIVFPRGNASETSAQTTRDDNGSRQQVVRKPVTYVAVTCYCSNQRSVGQEQVDTLQAVNHIVPPGSIVLKHTEQSRAFNAVNVNRFEGRCEQLTEEWAQVSALIGATQILCTGFVGPINDCGFFRAEIGAGTRAALDFFLFYVQFYYESMFSAKCIKGRLTRLKKVYEARECALTMWIKVAQHATENSDFNDVIRRAILDFQFDSISLTSCGNLVFTMICRCLSWVPVFIARCFIIDVGMPVVPIEILVELLTMQAPPRPGDSPLRIHYDRICAWCNECLAQCRFCPNPSGGGLSEYISSNGNIEGGVDEPGVFRQARRNNPWVDQGDPHFAHKLLANSIWSAFGNQLGASCALSKESLVCAIMDVLGSFTLTFDQMLGVNIHDSIRHLAFFNVSTQTHFSPIAPAVTPQKQPPSPFGIPAAWMLDGRECASFGLGLSFPQLLLLGSIIGDDLKDRIHPALIENMSRSLTQQIMLRAPSSMTVSSLVEVASFNCFTCELQPIDLSKNQLKRPLHILRPASDQFAVNGELPLCKGVGNFAPEDIFHNGALFGWANMLGVDITEVPATAEPCYYLELGSVYCIYNQATGCIGILSLDQSGASFEAETSPGSVDRVGKSFLPLSWHTDLAHEGFIILPMIRRSGACVKLNDTEMACLVRDAEAKDNFSPVNLWYTGLVRFAYTEPLEVLYVMKNLLPLGSLVLLKCESQSAGPYITRITMPLPSAQLPLHGIKAHLNVPNILDPLDGKVYVSVCVWTADGYTSEDIVVDPWELCLPASQRIVIPSIKSRARVPGAN